MKSRARKRQRPQRILEGSTTPVFIVGGDRRMLSFNSGCERLTGFPASAVVGQLCEYVTDPDTSSPEALAASLCPPPEALAGRIVSVPTYVACREGHPAGRIVHFHPLLGEDGSVGAVLGVMSPIEAPHRIGETGAAQSLHAELAALKTALRRRFGTKSLVCRSEAMLRVAEQLGIARAARCGVLICGEPGSGKEHAARLVHYEGELRTSAFVPLDCRALSPLELQQTLRRFFEQPHDEVPPALRPGTIFLSQVEHFPRDLQKVVVDALRGDGRSRDIRLLASTTRDPESLARGDELRPDFYHLLTPLCVSMPPLRRRMEDLPLLAQHLLEELNRDDARQLSGFADDVWERFQEYNWPGNIDELSAVVREARAACTETLVRAADLPFRFRTGFNAQAVGPVRRPEVVALEPYLARTEKEQIERALKECRYNKSKAAALLGLSRPRLYRRMETLGIADQPQLG
jgi:DNA-binding NtrC family response regulator